MGPNLTAAEGFILGVGAKMFTIAAPFIVCGVSASVFYGFIYWRATVLQCKKQNNPIAKKHIHRLAADVFLLYFLQKTGSEV